MGGDPSNAFTLFLGSQNIDEAKKIIEDNPGIVNETDDAGNTLFHLTFEKGKEFAMLLIEKGVDVNTRDQNGFSPLSYALEPFDQDLSDALLSKGADINERDVKGQTFLLVFVDRSSLPVVDYLVRQGADGALADDQGRTPLHVAIQKGDKDIIKLLVESYPDILHTQDNEGNTPLAYAIKNENAAFFLGLQIDDELPYSDEQGLELKGGGDDTPLHLAVLTNELANVATILKDNPKDINTDGKFDLSPLQIAFLKDNEPIQTLLMEYGARYKSTILVAAFAGKHVVVEKLLVKYDEDVNALDSHQNTPLHYAAKYGNTETVRILLKHKADPKRENDKGKTPCGIATKAEIQKMLCPPSCGVCNASP
jgi:ankyrin repeat protein